MISYVVEQIDSTEHIVSMSGHNMFLCRQSIVMSKDYLSVFSQECFWIKESKAEISGVIAILFLTCNETAKGIWII